MKPTILISLLITLLFFTSCTNQKTDESTSQDSIPEKVELSNEGVFIHHQLYGEGDTTLLLVHGWCIDQSYWEQQIEALKNQYQILAIDLVGFGKSGKNREEYSIEAYGRDVRAAIDQLELDNVILIGHSMGGDVILEAALDNDKVIALIGIDNFKDVSLGTDEKAQEEILNFMTMLKGNFSAVAPAYADQFLFHPDMDTTLREQLKSDFATSDSVSAIASLEALFAYGEKEPKQLTQLNKKLYLINSTAIPANWEGLIKSGVEYEVLDIDGTGHYPMVERPEAFNMLLSQVLNKISTPSTIE
ncbi:MAG: alpha/beta hydrolase [Bacteroidota bacterium]